MHDEYRIISQQREKKKYTSSSKIHMYFQIDIKLQGKVDEGHNIIFCIPNKY